MGKLVFGRVQFHHVWSIEEVVVALYKILQCEEHQSCGKRGGVTTAGVAWVVWEVLVAIRQT